MFLLAVAGPGGQQFNMTIPAGVGPFGTFMAQLPSARLADYCASKAALGMLHACLRWELRGTPRGESVRCLLVQPYLLDTPLFAGGAPGLFPKLLALVLPPLSAAEVARARAIASGLGLTLVGFAYAHPPRFHTMEAGELVAMAQQRALAIEADAKAALIDGLMASGRQVVDLGEAPPAVLHYATEVLESQSGVCLTGDGDQRALDVVINSELLHGDRLLTLRDRLLARNLDEGSGEREQRDLNDRYLNAVADDIILARPMSVAVQGTGATAGLAPRLLGELGCKVVAVEGTDVDALARTVGEQNLNLGLAFDAGGGLSLVASDGRLIAADRLLMLLARDLLERNPGADVLFNMTDNQALADLIRKQGGRPVMDDGGPARLRARMKELAVPLAGEANGHIFFADRWYGFSDALYAAARLLEVLSLQAGNSAEAFAPYTDTF